MRKHLGKTIEREGGAYYYPQLERLQDMDRAEAEELAKELWQRFSKIEDEEERESDVKWALESAREDAMQREHRCYTDDPLLTHPKVVEGLARWLNTSQSALFTQGPQRGLGGIESLRVAWNWAGVAIDEEEKISEKRIAGSDLTAKQLFQRAVRQTFPVMFVGGEVEATSDGLKGALDAKVVAKWKELPTTAAEFKELSRRASSAWHRTGERGLWLEQSEDTFPSGTRRGYRYDLCEVSTERVVSLLQGVTQGQYEEALAEGSDLAAKVVVEEDGTPQLELLALAGGTAAVIVRDLEPDKRHISHWLTAGSGGPIHGLGLT